MPNDPIAMNVEGVRDLIGSPTNKISTLKGSAEEGAKGAEMDVLDLPMQDEELLKLAQEWRQKYGAYESEYIRRYKANIAYYLGRQTMGTPEASMYPIDSNIIFEADETFIPAALAKNPDPVVYTDNSKEGIQLADDTETMLVYHADYFDLRAMLQRAIRQWTFYHLGVIKIGWDDEIKEFKIENRRIQDFIFNPDDGIDVKCHFPSWLGERIVISAQDLADMYPEHAEYIKLQVNDRMGTSVVYTEWWTDTFFFKTFRDKILEKGKNPHFKIGGKNHFAKPKKPFIFLSVYTLGEQPHDLTGNIEQNIPNQNRISKRTRQIDKNLTLQNNSVAFSGENFTQETAKQANRAIEDGNGILVPSGRPVGEAIVRFPAEGFPKAAFEELEVSKQDLRSIFGVQGISAQPQQPDVAARSMVMNQRFDSSRIGGGIGEAVERMAEAVFNWLVQGYHVFYNKPHWGAVLGQMEATQYVILSSRSFDRKLIVKVVPDSMKSKDEMTQMVQAQQDWAAGALGLKTYLSLRKYPDPHDTAADAMLWQMDKMAYMKLNFPDLAEQLQQSSGQPANTEFGPEHPTGASAEGPEAPAQDSLGVPTVPSGISGMLPKS